MSLSQPSRTIVVEPIQAALPAPTEQPRDEPPRAAGEPRPQPVLAARA
jgi:hypothetical protein